MNETEQPIAAESALLNALSILGNAVSHLDSKTQPLQRPDDMPADNLPGQVGTCLVEDSEVLRKVNALTSYITAITDRIQA